MCCSCNSSESKSSFLYFLSADSEGHSFFVCHAGLYVFGTFFFPIECYIF
jgi:hypothetical protein